MGGAPAPAPMDGASDVPPGPADPGMGGDPAMGPSEMPPADGNGQLDPNMDAGMEEPPVDDPSMGGEPPMDEPEGGEGDDSTISIINQLSPEDREAVRSYAESMLARDEEKNGGEELGGGEPPMDDPSMGGDPNGGPMMESVIFTKKQLKTINENFLQMSDDEEKKDKKVGLKKGDKLHKKSPFNSPKFK